MGGRKSLAPTDLSLFLSSCTILVMKTSFSHRNYIHFFSTFLFFLPVPAAFRQEDRLHPLTNATDDVGQTVLEINALIILLSHTNNVGGPSKQNRTCQSPLLICQKVQHFCHFNSQRGVHAPSVKPCKRKTCSLLFRLELKRRRK